METSTIQQKIDLIAELVFRHTQEHQTEKLHGIYTGEFGWLLFMFYYAKYSGNRKITSLTERYAETLLKQSMSTFQIHTFSSGLSGILYLFDFLRENHFIDIDVSDAQPYLDNSIITHMRRDIRQKNYDFMHGALGAGLYFLKKGNAIEYIRELVDFLYDTAEISTDRKIFKWESIMKIDKDIAVYNLALCHGISSIIIFLSRVLKSNIVDEKIIEMLTGAINYVLSQEIEFSQFGYSFPSYIYKNVPNVLSNSRVRLAWCYGDLGVGLSLWQAGKAVKKTEWKEKGLQILLQSTQRKDLAENFIIDAELCHGSAGISMIFRRMFIETNRHEFAEAAAYWLEQTLNFSTFNDGLAGYKTFIVSEWKCNYSLLTGISGIGLALLSYLHGDEQNWDEIFLLS